MQILKMLPSRAMSSLWGTLNNIELPVALRKQLFLLWTKAYNCNLDEMRDPLESYKNLGEFFARRLKEDARPIQEGMVL